MINLRLWDSIGVFKTYRVKDATFIPRVGEHIVLPHPKDEECFEDARVLKVGWVYSENPADEVSLDIDVDYECPDHLRD